MTTLEGELSQALQEYGDGRSGPEWFSAISLAVSIAGEDVVTATWGTTERGGSVPVTADSLFQIGSNTKAFTAVAMLWLEAQGALSTDYPIWLYLRDTHPELEPFGNSTLRELLSMTAHLESYDNLPAWETSYAAAPYAEVPAAKLIGMVKPDSASDPWHYSNTGYLLAQIVGDACANRIDATNTEAVIRLIIQQAGLRDTYITIHMYPRLAGRIVAGYYANDERGLQPLLHSNVTPFSLSWAQAAGSMVSKPTELVTWARQLYQRRSVLPEAQMSELLRLRSKKTGAPVAGATPGDPHCFGLGIAQAYDDFYAVGDKVYWYYVGETLGFRAAHLYWPGSDIALAVFINSRPTAKVDQSLELAHALYAIALRYRLSSIGHAR